jgi:hypothetical protein
MGGLIADIIFGFIFWSLVRMIYFVRSTNWRRVSGKILDVSVMDPGFGCPSVKMRFQLRDREHVWDGEDALPFALIGDAKRFAQRFHKDKAVMVRINPARQSETRLFRIDQK